MNEYERQEQEAAAQLAAELAKPFDPEPRADGCYYEEDAFDPWSLFPAVYGTYSSDFDDCAIDVLMEIASNEPRRDDLGAWMFREMLCTSGFCSYGTSPRVCFWVLDRALLDALIARWREWRERQWSK